MYMIVFQHKNASVLSRRMQEFKESDTSAMEAFISKKVLAGFVCTKYTRLAEFNLEQNILEQRTNTNQ